MNAAEFTLYQLQIDRYYAARRLLVRVGDQLAEARALLYRHQWGGSGYCPECAADMDHGHSEDCPWYRTIVGMDQIYKPETETETETE